MYKKYHFAAVLKHDDKSYLVSSCEVLGTIYELMVFSLGKDFEPCVEKKYNFNEPMDILTMVEDYTYWNPIIERRYESMEEAEADFDRIVKNFDKFFENDDDDEDDDVHLPYDCESLYSQSEHILENCKELKDMLEQLLKLDNDREKLLNDILKKTDVMKARTECLDRSINTVE